MELRVLLVCPVSLYREGLRRALDDHPRLHTVGVAASLAQAASMLSCVEVDLILADVDWSRDGTIARELLESIPRVRALAIGVPEREEDVLTCAEAGVAGIVPPEASMNELVQCMDAAQRDELVCSARVAGTLLRRVTTLARTPPATDPVASLTPRETRLLELIERGMSNKEIANTLDIELSTVKNHVHNILEKLRVRRRGQAAALMHRSRTAHAIPADGCGCPVAKPGHETE